MPVLRVEPLRAAPGCPRGSSMFLCFFPDICVLCRLIFSLSSICPELVGSVERKPHPCVLATGPWKQQKTCSLERRWARSFLKKG